MKVSEKWEETLSSLRSEVLSALSRVDQDAVEVTVGRTAITRDRAAVVLSWNRCVRPSALWLVSKIIFCCRGFVNSDLTFTQPRS